MIAPDILSKKDESFGSAVDFGLKRIRSWRVPPNWSRVDWLEELMAVGTAAAWQSVCDYDPKRGIPLASFGYRRMIAHCLARYRREWRYALRNVVSTSGEEEIISFNHPGLGGSSIANTNKVNHSRCDLRDAVGALPAEHRRLIEQLFWEERTETELANTMSINQSTINRRKRTILKALRIKLSDHDRSSKTSHKLLVTGNLANWLPRY
jgi:RNA polymerase sigma factor (sigma-70 family)